VTLSRCPDATLIAVKTAVTADGVRWIRRDAATPEKLRHLLVLEFREYRPWTANWSSATVTEVAGNRSLANYLPSGKNELQGQLRGETGVARIIVGIVLAMRYLHSETLVIVI
jgi:hypothetical protein